MFLKEFFYMPRSDRRTFTFLCTLILVVAILLGALSNTDDTSNKIESPEKAAKTRAERYGRERRGNRRKQNRVEVVLLRP